MSRSPTAIHRLWRHLHDLAQKGTLLQAVGIPLRHVLAAYGVLLCIRGAVSWQTYLLAYLLWPISGLGVTAGAHRLWTHQSYTASYALEVILLLMYSVADQGPIVGWALTHALHHRGSDTSKDPHNRCDGFWFAHIGWLFSAQSFFITSQDYVRVLNGLGPLVRLHDLASPVWDPLISMGLPALVAAAWGEALAGFFVAGALRWACVQHITFFVNSIAHGERAGSPYAFDSTAEGIGPRPSLLVTDYAAAELNAWDQWNPTKVFIDVCAFTGLASGLRRCSPDGQEARRAQLQPTSRSKVQHYTVVGLPFLRHRVPLQQTVPCSRKGDDGEQDGATDDAKDQMRANSQYDGGVTLSRNGDLGSLRTRAMEFSAQ